jgi:regulation of enolase protein 1 (concanavalin A-like superfamily)
MIRENDTPGSPHLNLATTSGHGLHPNVRFAQDAATIGFDEVGPANRPQANLWTRLQRVGYDIAGFYSRDGIVWTQADFPPQTLPTLNQEALFGLALTSHRDGSLATAKFDQVSVQPGVVSAYGVQACGGDRSVLLQWRRVPNAVAYNVYRAPLDGTRDQFTWINTDAIPGTSFVDSSSALTNGTTMLYAVAPVLRGAGGNLGEGPAVAVPATPVGVPGFFGCSISEGPKTGSASFDSATGEVTVRGSGWDIYNHADQGYFLLQPVEGDFEFTTTMLTRQSGDRDGAPAGIIARESLDGGARNLGLMEWSVNGLWRQWRPVAYEHTGASFRNQSQAVHNNAFRVPVVLRLTRKGDTLSSSYSADGGKTFRGEHAVTFSPPLAKTLYVGYAGCSGVRNQLGTVKFTYAAPRKL